jgi:hypothetical protein
MKVAKMLLAALALVLSVPGESHASNYPPDYPVCNMRDSVTSGPFEIIRHTTMIPSRQSSLTVSYRGYLRGKYADNQIKLYVSLNGQNPQPILGTPMLQARQGSYNDAYVYLHAGRHSCYMCTWYSGSRECQDYLAAGGQAGVWMCQEPGALENHMFQWAFDPYGYLNAWDVSVAAEANGEWDSNFGMNYYGRLPERRSCAY